jgi:DNA-binding transcriptional MerR regulator
VSTNVPTNIPAGSQKGLDFPVTGRCIVVKERRKKKGGHTMKAGLTIGELAGELQLNPKTIRYYEDVGLLPEPRRSESGYRLYSRYEVERLRLIKRAKLLGLSLAEIKELVAYAIDGRCGIMEDRLFSLVKAKLNEIDQKIEDLVIFRDNLRQYHVDLSNKLASGKNRERGPTDAASCRCLGEEADISPKLSLPLGPGKVNRKKGGNGNDEQGEEGTQDHDP